MLFTKNDAIMKEGKKVVRSMPTNLLPRLKKKRTTKPRYVREQQKLQRIIAAKVALESYGEMYWWPLSYQTDLVVCEKYWENMKSIMMNTHFGYHPILLNIYQKFSFQSNEYSSSDFL
ncbi:hypothetical protein Glove_5g29 [Diversispora epigaea]|uniref:Uncharacterized protein n=1 Tax=Diversispora epigaea TaxID=1348612 RepID=A0A397JQF9_9GLOM|nr:hypothetical protein Glove_5g29 [Diversispora epigaea]